MALDINGYNATFKAFADFAANHIAANGGKTIANATVQQPLGGRKIVAVDVAQGDSVHKWTRGVEQWVVNDRTRGLFKKAIADMFGGESKIPASVKKAMLLGDYNAGKPLTARRILAVKAAIDADGTAKALAAKSAEKASLARIKSETFASHDVEGAALELGFTKAEMPKLARATHLYAQVTGKTEMDAMKEVAEPGSKANRLMQYGGRFLASAQNFENGLRLMDSFATWFAAARATKNADSNNTFANAKSFTDLNLNSYAVTHDSKIAFERFLFEDLAVNPDANLAENDPEKIFGMKNNAAMRFFGAGRYGNFAGVMAAVPPEKRGTIFAVFDKLAKPLPETKKAALAFKAKDISVRGVVRDPNLVISRILRHLPEIEKLMADGAFNEKNIVKTLFPDMPSRDWTLKGMNKFTHNADELATKMLIDGGMDEEEAENVGSKAQLVMEETCCTLQEACEALKTGKRVAPPPYMTTATFPIENLDGTTKAARSLLDGGKSGDLWRAYNYAPADDPGNPAKFFVKGEANQSFGFTFPDGTVLRANAGTHKGNIPTILDKLEALAGRVHPRQQSALMFAVSQAGIGMLKGGLLPFGINSSEHACVDFTLLKNEETGAITVKYTSPKDLPLSFSWTATIDTDGNMTSTPLKVEGAVAQLDARAAQAMVADACRRTGVALDADQTRRAAELMQRHCTAMFDKNANVFANFVVRLKLTDDAKAKEDDLAADMARNIRQWIDFKAGSKIMEGIENAVKENFNETIEDEVAAAGTEGARHFAHKGDEISNAFRADANRGVFTINGQVFRHAPADQVEAAFTQAVKGTANRQGLSSILNQMLPNSFSTLANRAPLAATKKHPDGPDTANVPGIETIVSRSAASGKYMMMTASKKDGESAHYDLQVAEDGKSATIRCSVKFSLAEGAGNNDSIMASYGTVTYGGEYKIDLSGEKPVVTDVKISQSFSENV